MSKSVVSLTKQTGKVTPYWLLQQMAAIDAILIFKFADKKPPLSSSMNSTPARSRGHHLCFRLVGLRTSS
jgi:hypothetical protein